MDIKELMNKSTEDLLKSNCTLIERSEYLADYSLNTISKEVIESQVIRLDNYGACGFWKFSETNVCHLFFVYKDKLYAVTFDAIFVEDGYPLLIEGAQMYMEYYCDCIDMDEYSKSEDSWEELWNDD